MTSIVPNNAALAKLEKARLALSEARTLPEVKKIHDQAQAVKVYARAEKMGIEMQNYAGEIVAEASWRMGEFLLTMDKQFGARGVGKKVESSYATPLLPTLKDLGISKNQSSNCQAIAKLPREEFRAHISAVKESGQVLTTGSLVVAAKQYTRKMAHEKAKAEPIVCISNPTILLLRASAFDMPIADKSVQTIVTSPPYFGLREYHGKQGDEPFGQEKTVDAYVDKSIQVLKECRRVLRDDGILFWNIADSYVSSGAGVRRDLTGLLLSSPKQSTNRGCVSGDKQPRKRVTSVSPGNLFLIPQRIAIAAQEDGWCVRSIIIWEKLNPMPESVKNRPTRAYEEILMLTKSNKYFWNWEGAQEPSTGKTASFPRLGKNHGKTLTRNDIKYDRSMGKCPSEYVSDERNIRNVWTFAVPHSNDHHFGTFPEELPRCCISLASKPGDVVLDPFQGSGTTGVVAQRLRRKFVGLDLAYHDLAQRRIRGEGSAA